MRPSEAFDFDRFVAQLDRYFEPRLAEHGGTARGVDWNSPEAQERRFAELVRICPRGERFSIIDYGCGYGALFDHLAGAGYDAEYVGYDVSERMIDHAVEMHPGARDCRFTASESELEPADHVIASGVFNLRFDVDDDAWRDYVVATLERLNGLARRGLAFNMLTSYSDPDRMRPDLYYADPCFFFDLCKRSFSRDVALLHDYGLYEFTILVRK